MEEQFMLLDKETIYNIFTTVTYCGQGRMSQTQNMLMELLSDPTVGEHTIDMGSVIGMMGNYVIDTETNDDILLGVIDFLCYIVRNNDMPLCIPVAEVAEDKPVLKPLIAKYKIRR